MKNTLYYIKQTGERVKVQKVWSSGLCECVNRSGDKVFPFIGDLSRVI